MVRKVIKKKKSRRPIIPDDDPSKRPPKSFIFRRGKVGSTVKQLITDLREVMRPNTATNLRESTKNGIRDFINVAGPLGVSHFIIFSATDLATYMRLVKIPQGPTLTFRLHNYSLVSDIARMQDRPHSPGGEYKTAPILVLNNFGSEDRNVKLMTIAFQNLFPTISVQTFQIEDCKRIVLVHYDKETERVHIRHYLIRVNPAGVSQSVKKIVQKRLESLDQFEDIADYVIKGSTPDAEDTPENQVEAPKQEDQPATAPTKNAIRLQEIGPRMELQLIKIEEGACDGTVLYHHFIKKSFGEMEALAKRKEELKKLKDARRKQQDRNVAAKKQKAGGKGAAAAVMPTEEEEANNGVPMAVDDENDDIEWYRREVGEEPDVEETAELKARTASSAKDKDKQNKKKRKASEVDLETSDSKQSKFDSKRRKMKASKPKK